MLYTLLLPFQRNKQKKGLAQFRYKDPFNINWNNEEESILPFVFYTYLHGVFPFEYLEVFIVGQL
jgi:hypothetical protein